MLPCNIVDGNLIETFWKIEIEGKREIRRLHHLKEEDIYPSDFDKMNVGAAVRFFSIKTAVALETALEEGNLPRNSAITTAWFIRRIAEWFSILTSRIRKTSITARNCDRKYIFLHFMIELFQNPVIGKEWKPLNYAVILSTLSFCDVAESLFLREFDFILGHRFSQDATENIFSQIKKRAGKTPNMLQCLEAIRTLSMAQFISPVTNTNYMSDADVFLLDSCATKP